MIHRWRVTVKVTNTKCRHLGVVYTASKMYDSEPDPFDWLFEVMNSDMYKADHFYGEATKEQVWHTNRSQLILS